ncbi:hypothetical protein DERF_010971 [Dermatophagoides farinae]|uniref:Uncharacterized protein n=1 Tax=Dermatophagoides farinae TaxID=6954 RepID=A0A922L4C4_DERFA|nr:hypothetical protein DERF_010971 [Dermatophagoides farinae]
MEALKKLFTNLTNVVVHGGNVVVDDGQKNNVNLATENYTKLRGRDSQQNMMMIRKNKNFATKITNNDENAVVFDPTRKIETKIKNKPGVWASVVFSWRSSVIN